MFCFLVSMKIPMTIVMALPKRRKSSPHVYRDDSFRTIKPVPIMPIRMVA